MPKIECLYAWISYDQNETDEGVAAYLDGQWQAWMPMVGADLARMRSLRGAAVYTMLYSGKRHMLVKFGGAKEREVLEVLEPPPKEILTTLQKKLKEADPAGISRLVEDWR